MDDERRARELQYEEEHQLEVRRTSIEPITDGSIRDAVVLHHVPTIRWHLMRGTDVHAVDIEGDSLLHVAIACRLDIGPPPACSLEETVRLLLDAGVDPNARAHRGDTPLHVALRTWWSMADVVDLLMNGGADPDLPNDTGKTPVDVFMATRLKGPSGPGPVIQQWHADYRRTQSRIQTRLDEARQNRRAP
jgi:hypothetical protein